MERFWYLACGFFVAVCLGWIFFLIKDQWENEKEKGERKVKQLAEVVFYEELQKVIGYYPCSLGDFVDKRIDQILAEKEGEQ